MTLPDAPLVNPLDAVAGIAALFAAWRGYRRGLSAEFWPLLSVVGAAASAFWCAHCWREWLISHTRLTYETAGALAFTAGAAGGFLAVIMAALAIRLVVSLRFNDAIEKPGGLIAGLAGGLLAIFLIFASVILWPHDYLRLHFGERSLVGRGTTFILRWRGFDIGQPAPARAPHTKEPATATSIEI